MTDTSAAKDAAIAAQPPKRIARPPRRIGRALTVKGNLAEILQRAMATTASRTPHLPAIEKVPFSSNAVVAELTKAGKDINLVYVTVEVPDTAAAAVTDVLNVVLESIGDSEEARARVMRALLPPDRLDISPAVLTQVSRDAAAREQLATEFGLLSAADVAAQAGSSAGNASALASRWRLEDKIFAVETNAATGSLRYPGFQFTETGRPRPVIAEVLRATQGRLIGWELALWFTGANGWLGSERPVDHLDDPADTPQVVDAVRRLAEEILDDDGLDTAADIGSGGTPGEVADTLASAHNERR